MFIPSEDHHRFFSKLSCEDHDEVVYSGGVGGGGGSSSSSEDDVRAAALNNGSFADSVGLLPALPETSSSSSEGFSQNDDDESDLGEEDDRAQLYPKSGVAQHRLGILRLFGARQQKTSRHSESSSKVWKRTNKEEDDIDYDANSTLTQQIETFRAPTLESTPAIPINGDDATYTTISNLTGLPAVTEEEDLQLSDRKSDEMMSQSSVEHVLRTVTQNLGEEGGSGMHPTLSWDSYSFSSHGGGSRSRTKVERKKKKKSHRIPSSSTSHLSEGETLQRMETELEARLNVILQLKDTVVKQHEAMEQLSKASNKLKAKLRIATRALKAAQSRIDEDAEIIQRLELELNVLKLI